MSNEKSAASAVNFGIAEIAVCDETHRVRFFCQRCDHLFCGDCYTIAHRLENRDHEVEIIHERIEREVGQIGTQMNELKQLAEDAEAAANARDQKAYESSETIIQLIADIERLMMTSASTRESQQLRCIHRDCLAVLHWTDNSQKAVNPVEDPIGAMVSSRSINATLKQQLQKATQVVKLTSGSPPTDPMAAIVKSVIKFAGKKTVAGLQYSFCKILQCL